MSRSSRIHLRNRQKLQNYLLDKAVMTIAFIEPLTTFGQIFQIWKHKNVSGNSLFTWSFFAVSAIIWLFYGIKLKNKPLIISSFLWVVTETIVVAQILYYS
jgi:uncharacterized protein with PQ loop repeat